MMKKIRLLLSSLMFISLLTNCKGNNTYTIIWRNDDGTILEKDDNVPYGAMPSYDHSAPSKPSTEEYSYVFSGWDHELIKVTSDQIYVAQYKSITNTYTIIWQNDDGTEIKRDTDVRYGSTPSTYKPKDPSKPEDDKGVYQFKGWDGDINQGITGNVTFKAVYNTTHKYSVSIGKTDKLKFETLDGKPINTVRAYENQDFKFKMKIDESSNPIDYIVPSTLSVEVKDVGKLVDGVSIVPDASDQEAMVTIEGSKITNEITISGNAIKSGNYAYTVSSYYGLKPIDDGTGTAGEDTILTFETIDDSFALPEAENIYVYFDAVDMWVSPAEQGVAEEYCSYNKLYNYSELTIKSNHIRSNIDIKARAHGYPLLDDLEWKDINKLSLSGAAPYLFYIGEEKTINVDDVDQKVRIIDFNHDELEASTPENPLFAGITFEFVNTINNYAVCWNNAFPDESTNFNFINSTLNKSLQPYGAAYNKMPAELMNIIKTVNKKVDIHPADSWVKGNYNTKLFILSYEEMDAYGDTEIYEFYNLKEPLERHKKRYKDKPYWSRSPDLDYAHSAWYLEPNGLGTFKRIDDPCNIAPAFCV